MNDTKHAPLATGQPKLATDKASSAPEGASVSEASNPSQEPALPAGLTAADRVILFDGVCVVCSAWVDFVIARDPDAKFLLSSVQSEPGREILAFAGVDPDNCDTMAYVEDGKVTLKSTAFLRIVRHFGGLWPLLGVGGFVAPRFLRDFIYDRIAKNRYWLFGKRDTCTVPTPEVRARFLL